MNYLWPRKPLLSRFRFILVFASAAAELPKRRDAPLRLDRLGFVCTQNGAPMSRKSEPGPERERSLMGLQREMKFSTGQSIDNSERRWCSKKSRASAAHSNAIELRAAKILSGINLTPTRSGHRTWLSVGKAASSRALMLAK